MSFLGDDKGWAWPQLKDAVIPPDVEDAVYAKLYKQIIGEMRIMYQVCQLVHADLSEFNLLYVSS
jgi:RIO kinase 1